MDVEERAQSPRQGELRIRRKAAHRNQEQWHNSIQRAIQENDANRLTKLLGQKVKLRLTAEDLAVALMEAVSQGKAECVSPLLAAKADPNCVDEDGRTPMIVCMDSKAGGNPVILRELLKAGASPNKATWNNHQTALHLASRKGYQVTVKLLLSAGARVDKADVAGCTPLLYASREGHFTAVKMLLEQGATPDAVNRQMETPLLLAAKNGNVDCVEELLECGASPNSRDAKGQTALMLALQGSHTDMVELLMSYNCDINTQNVETGKTVLHWAVQNGDLKLIQTLLRMGAEPNIRDKEWETPFITALLNKRLDVVSLLMKFKCNITVTDKHFNTGLHLAAREGIGELIPMFLKAGLDCNLKTSAGQTPLMLAALGGHVDIVSCLLSCGANPDVMDRYRATALVYAIMSKASDEFITPIAKILIRTGCQLDEAANLLRFNKDNNLDTNKRCNQLESRPYIPLEIAFLRGRPLIFLVLLKSGCSLKEFPQEMLKHGQDVLSSKRTDFRTVLYLLKHVKLMKKRFPSLKELCRRPALILYKNATYKAHVSAVKPPKDIMDYIILKELNEVEATFKNAVASSKESGKTDTEPGNTRTSEGSAFSRLSNLRSTYTLGSTIRRKTTTNGSNNSYNMSGGSSEDDEVFKATSPTTNIPRTKFRSTPRPPNTRSKTIKPETNGRLSSNSSTEYSNNGIENWILNQNPMSQNSSGRKTPVTQSPALSRKNRTTPTRNHRNNNLKVSISKALPSLSNMLYASPPAESTKMNGFRQTTNRDSIISNDTGFQSEDLQRCDSPTQRDLMDLKTSMMWKNFTTPFDSWESESVDSASVASVNGSIDSRDTDLSDLSRGSNSNSMNGNHKLSGSTRSSPAPNGTPTMTRRSKIPVPKRPSPGVRNFNNNRTMKSSHFEEVDDVGPGVFVRSKSCRK